MHMDYHVGLTRYNNIHPQHNHKNFEIIIYLQGTGSLWLSSEEHPVRSGMIAVIPPGISHHSAPQDSLQSIYIQGNFGHILNIERPIILNDNAEGDGIALTKMIYRSHHEDHDYTDVLCNALVHFILKNMRFDDEVSLAVRKIVHEMTEHFHDHNLNVTSLLNQSGYAEDYIRARFRKVTGQTPTGFLAALRIRHACYLMDIYRNSLTLADVSAQCGYTDYVLFSKRFKEQTGISPRTYRNQL